MYCSASYTAGVDFTPISQIIYFPSGSGPRNRTCVSIPIIDDSLEEESEFFNLYLFVCDTAIAVTRATANCTIMDNDSKSFCMYNHKSALDYSLKTL